MFASSPAAETEVPTPIEVTRFSQTLNHDPKAEAESTTLAEQATGASSSEPPDSSAAPAEGATAPAFVPLSPESASTEAMNDSSALPRFQGGRVLVSRFGTTLWKARNRPYTVALGALLLLIVGWNLGEGPSAEETGAASSGPGTISATAGSAKGAETGLAAMARRQIAAGDPLRSEEHTSELQSH